MKTAPCTRCTRPDTVLIEDEHGHLVCGVCLRTTEPEVYAQLRPTILGMLEEARTVAVRDAHRN